MGNSIADCNLPHGIEQNTNPNGSSKKREHIALLLLQSIYCVCLSVRLSLPASLPSFHCSKTKTKRDQTLLGLLKTILRKHSLLPKILQMQLNPITIQITITGRIEHKNTTHPKKHTHKHTNTGSDTQNSQFSLSDPNPQAKHHSRVHSVLSFFFFVLFLLGRGEFAYGLNVTEFQDPNT
jgi:hypothetical protein